MPMTIKWIRDSERHRRLPAYKVVGACVIFCLTASVAIGESASEERAFEQRVLDTILSNPEIIVVALGKLKEQEDAAKGVAQSQRIAAVLPELFGEDYAERAVVLAEFFDYRCSFCTTVAPDVAGVEAEAPGSVVYIELPILGEPSVALSRFALAVRALHGEDLYHQFHHALMQIEPRFRNLMGANRIAQSLGLDPRAIAGRAQEPDISSELRRNRELASRLGIQGTPAFVGRRGVHTGNVTTQSLLNLAKKEPTK